MKKCQRCGTERINTAIKVCIKCGFMFVDKSQSSDYSQKVIEYERKFNDLKSKKSNGKYFLIFLMVILGFMYIGDAFNKSNNKRKIRESADIQPRNIKYEVTGSSKYIDVTLQNSGGNTEQYTRRSVPYTYSFVASKGQFLYISAQAQSYGSVETRIYVNDKIIESSTSRGEHVIASASGRCP